MKTKTLTPSLWWFINHEIIVEFSRGTLKNRVIYAIHGKPVAEQKVKLRAIQRVKSPSELPTTIIAAGAEYAKVCADFIAAGDILSQISDRINKEKVTYNEAKTFFEALGNGNGIDCDIFDSFRWAFESASAAKARADLARDRFSVVFSEYDAAHHKKQEARNIYDKAIARHLPALVSQYLREYPENELLLDHKTGRLIFNKYT